MLGVAFYQKDILIDPFTPADIRVRDIHRGHDVSFCRHRAGRPNYRTRMSARGAGFSR